jgi:predicted RND superfamily exporter protein
MLVTTLAVTIGFLALMRSEFLGLANLGLLIGVSLFAAVLADLFLTPIMLMRLRPKLV